MNFKDKFPGSRQTICLCMIVKNETPVITRCLNSLKGFIDTWIIVDTGSSDGTQDMIRQYLSELPGELIERPWVNFAHNRSEALIYAKGKADYIFIIDADETLEFEETFVIPRLEYDSYNFSIESGSCSYYKMQLVNNRLTWSFKNVLHEYICSEEPATESVMPGVKTLRFPDGARARDPNTYRKDAALLKEALETDPTNSRYLFYLAQSYRDANEPLLAIEYYEKRVSAGGWNEEVWYSLYQVAQLKENMGIAWPEVLNAYLAAYQYKPDRAGPMYRAGIYYQGKRAFHNSFLFLRQAMDISYPVNDRLFIEKNIYDYLLPIEYAVAAYYVGRHDEAIRVNNELLNSGKLPPELIDRVIENRRFSLDIYNPRKREPSLLPHIIVVIPFCNPTPEFDNLVDTLLYQDYQHCNFLFLDDGSNEDSHSRIALEDKRFVLKINKKRIGWSESLRKEIFENKDSIILPLNDHVWMASPDSLSKLAQSFSEYDCDMLFGQSRLEDGNLGKATPFTSAEQAKQSNPTRETVFPIAIKAGLLNQLHDFNNYAEFARLASRSCPFHKQHFSDTPFVVVNDEHLMYCDEEKIQDIVFAGKQEKMYQ